MVPMRSCIACRSRESSKELLHLVLVAGQVTPDPEQRLGGRGAWLHPNCFEVAKLRSSFKRAFKSGGNLQTEELENFLKSSSLINQQEPKEQK